MKDEYCYAKQFLAEQEIELYVGNRRILKWEGNPRYKLYEYKTYIEKGIPLTETTQRKIINTYKEVLRLGFMIIARPTDYDERTYGSQKVIYELIARDPNIKDVGEIPRRTYPHWVEYDVENKMLRLVGMTAGIPRRPGRGQWVKIPDKNPVKRSEPVVTSFTRYLDNKKVKNILTNFRKRLAPLEEGPDFQEIEEIPFMITDNNEVVCIEDTNDPPVIAAVGTRGSGKTMAIHTITDAVYNKGKGRVVIFNDRQRQFLTWPLPSSVEGFNRENQKVCHFPTPLPCVFLYPTDYNLREVDFKEEDVGFEITLPYGSIVDNYKYFFQGRKNWELGGSERYFKALRPYLKMCNTIEQVKNVVEEKLDLKTNKGLKGTYEKIMRTMEDLFEMKILDINTGIPSKWRIRYQDKDIGSFYPVSTALSVGLIPVVENGHIYTKDYYPQYMRWLIQDLYENLLNKRLPYDERTWMIVDEIGQIYKKNKARTVAAEALIDTVTEGRKPNLACAYTLQSWTQVDEEIQLNTTEVLAFNTNQSKDVSELTSAFSLDKEEREELKNLKTFECLAMTKKRWVVYDMDGNRYYTEEPVKGKILFPTSQHTKVGQ